MEEEMTNSNLNGSEDCLKSTCTECIDTDLPEPLSADSSPLMSESVGEMSGPNSSYLISNDSRSIPGIHQIDLPSKDVQVNDIEDDVKSIQANYHCLRAESYISDSVEDIKDEKDTKISSIEISQSSSSNLNKTNFYDVVSSESAISTILESENSSDIQDANSFMINEKMKEVEFCKSFKSILPLSNPTSNSDISLSRSNSPSHTTRVVANDLGDDYIGQSSNSELPLSDVSIINYNQLKSKSEDSPVDLAGNETLHERIQSPHFEMFSTNFDRKENDMILKIEKTNADIANNETSEAAAACFKLDDDSDREQCSPTNYISSFTSEFEPALTGTDIERSSLNIEKQQNCESETFDFLSMKCLSSCPADSNSNMTAELNKEIDDGSNSNLVRSDTSKSEFNSDETNKLEFNLEMMVEPEYSSENNVGSESYLQMIAESESNSEMIAESESNSGMTMELKSSYEMNVESESNSEEIVKLKLMPDIVQQSESEEMVELESNTKVVWPIKTEEPNLANIVKLKSNTEIIRQPEFILERSVELLSDMEVTSESNSNPKNIADLESNPKMIIDSDSISKFNLESESLTDKIVSLDCNPISLDFKSGESIACGDVFLSSSDNAYKYSSDSHEVGSTSRKERGTNTSETDKVFLQTLPPLNTTVEIETKSTQVVNETSRTTLYDFNINLIKTESDLEENQVNEIEENIMDSNRRYERTYEVEEVESKLNLVVKQEIGSISEVQDCEKITEAEAFSTDTREILNVCEYILEENFDWDHYLEETNSEAAPPTAFLHVEQSLETGVKEGQCLEVLLESKEQNEENDMEKDIIDDPDWVSYWPAKVISSCGNLLRIRYLGSSASKSTNAVEFWCDLSSRNIKPVGWSLTRNIPMLVPPSVTSTSGNLILDENSLKNLDTVPEEVLNSSRREIFARIQEGNLLEVLDIQSPDEGCIVEVKQNKGGRLLLQDVFHGELTKCFWTFFLDPQIKPLGWIKQRGEPYRYKSPEASQQFVESYNCSATQTSLSFLPSFQIPATNHSVEVGMYLEAVMPITLQSIHVAVVSAIINDSHFELTIEDHMWVTTMDDPLLLPCNFCRDHHLDLTHERTKEEFKWDEYLASFGGKMVPYDLLPHRMLSSDAGFEEGHKLEAVNPQDPNKICIATIEKTVEHLLLLKLDTKDNFFYRPASSMDIFPVGWTQSSTFPLSIPSLFAPRRRNSSADQNENLLAIQSKENPLIILGNGKSGKTSNNSMWCPKLYINHFCYPGPYLSKTKVAKMSRSVGPGPVPLVLHDVIGMTINAGYIPTRVLRELQNLRMMNSSWQAIPMKAKFKRHILKANVNIPSAAREMNGFLVEFSKILLSCPNLWSHEPIGENCPFVCNRQNLSLIPSGTAVFRGRGIRGCSSRRKRGGKKRLFYPIKTSTVGQDDTTDRQREGDDEEFCEPDDGEDGDEGLSGSEWESRPPSPSFVEGQRKLKQKRILSSLEITMNESRVFDLSKERGTKRGRGETDPTPSLRGSFTSSPNQRKRTRQDEGRDEPPNAIYGLEPAHVTSDPLEWSVEDVERYVASQPAICHHAVRLREHEVDGRALLLLNLPSLVHHLSLPHGAAVSLAQHICKVKMAHFLFFYPELTEKR